MTKAAIVVVVVVVALAAGMYALQLESAQALRTKEAIPWKLRDSPVQVGPDAQTLHLLIAVPDCGAETGRLTPRVDYRPTEVAVEMDLDYEPGCLMGGGPATFDLALSEPVGIRTITSLADPAPAWPYSSTAQFGRIPSWSEWSETNSE